MDFEELDKSDKKNKTGGYKNKRGLMGFICGLLVGIVGLVAIGPAYSYVNAQFSQAPRFNFNPFNNLFSTSQSYDESTDLSWVQSKINKIYRILDEYYVNDYSKKDTIESLYYGIVYGVGDPYTVYMDKNSYTKFKEETEGSYAGIGVGVNIDKTDNTIIVISPFEGGPGAKAGLLPEDKIIRVNGNDVRGDTLDSAISMMKGEPGTTVSLTVYRTSDDKYIDLDIIRENIDVPTVKHKMLDDNIGYIRITQFDRVTYDQFLGAYNELKANMSGLIIDLRNNPGGLLNVVTDITDLLVPEGTIVYQEDKHGNKTYAKSNSNHIEVPLLVLVNGNSASASEVLSGAVQDMGVGQLVGTQTFGKGVVQNIVDLGDGSAIKITIAKYYTPSGRCIQDIGLTPDYKVEMDNAITTQMFTSDLSEEDTQLKMAISIMDQKIGVNNDNTDTVDTADKADTTDTVNTN